MTNLMPTETAEPTASKNTSAAPPSDEQMLEQLDKELPKLRVFLVAQKLMRNSPELLNRVPEDLRNRLQMGDPSVLSEILRTQPELFRDKMLGRLEDEAFSQLLSAREPSQPQPSETSPEPSLA
jgi:hypothetical protein